MITLTASVHSVQHQIEPFFVVLAKFLSKLAIRSVRAGRGTAARPPHNSNFYSSSSALLPSLERQEAQPRLDRPRHKQLLSLCQSMSEQRLAQTAQSLTCWHLLQLKLHKSWRS